VKWLTLSLEKFEPIPDIQFSFKKPLFAASVVLKFTQTHGHLSEADTRSATHIDARGEVLAFASLEARVPLKGLLHYTVEALSSRAGRVFGFSFIRESDVTGGSSRETHVRTTDGRETLDVDGAKVDVINESPAPLLAHVLTLPAFVQTHSVEETLYGAHLMMGRRVQALRLERKGRARSQNTHAVETYEGKLMTIAHALGEKEFEALPWATRKGFEFDWNAETKQIVAARFSVPIFGMIEIKA
jgi:hypothetical protein